MKRLYELTFIMPANIGEAEHKVTEQKVIDWVTGAEGEVKVNNHWGRRRLAYAIGTNREGYYIYLQCELPPQALNDLSYKLNIDPNILRHLIVRLDE